MKKLKLAAILGCALALCLALVGCGPSKESYVGTWDLQSSEIIDETDVPAAVYTEDEMNSLRESDLDIYLTLRDNGLAVFNQIGSLTDGKWEANGGSGKITFDLPSTVNAEDGTMEETTEASLKLSGDTLIMEMNNTSFTFKKGEDKDPYEDSLTGIEVADENGMSLIMTESEQMSPVTVADTDAVSIVIDGKGVDAIGDPGFNLQIENKTTNTINVWVPENIKYGDKDVRCYLYITLNPGMKTTTFMQFDYQDAESSDWQNMPEVSGTIQVDNAETGQIIETFDFTI